MRQLAVESIQRAQKKYQTVLHYFVSHKKIKVELGSCLDFGTTPTVHATSIQDYGKSMVKIYFSQDPVVQVHQSRAKSCPSNFPDCFHWYGGKWCDSGYPPKWVLTLIDSVSDDDNNTVDEKNTIDEASDKAISQENSVMEYQSQPTEEPINHQRPLHRQDQLKTHDFLHTYTLNYLLYVICSWHNIFDLLGARVTVLPA